MTLPFSQFKQMMKKAKPGQRICYHHGLLIDDRENDPDLDMTAKFCRISYETNTARIYQVRNGDACDYFVVLRERLRIRKDEQGTYQEAERLMSI